MGEIIALSNSRLLLDTNIVIGILNNSIRAATLPPDLFIAAITVTELYALAGMGETEEQKINAVLNWLEIIPITAAIAKRAGFLVRTRPRHTSDMLIAATALEHGLTLLTRNSRDFTLPGLDVLAL